jgi:hypothetical protein
MVHLSQLGQCPENGSATITAAHLSTVLAGSNPLPSRRNTIFLGFRWVDESLTQNMLVERRSDWYDPPDVTDDMAAAGQVPRLIRSLADPSHLHHFPDGQDKCCAEIVVKLHGELLFP